MSRPVYRGRIAGGRYPTIKAPVGEGRERTVERLVEEIRHLVEDFAGVSEIVGSLEVNGDCAVTTRRSQSDVKARLNRKLNELAAMAAEKR